MWFSGFIKPLSRIGLCRFEEYTPGKPLKILLVGYNGARNTGADARVVALTQQLEQTLGADKAELTVMTLDTENVNGYFTKAVNILHFSTVFIFSLVRACSSHHAAILCEGWRLWHPRNTACFGHQLPVNAVCRPSAVRGSSNGESPTTSTSAMPPSCPKRLVCHLCLPSWLWPNALRTSLVRADIVQLSNFAFHNIGSHQFSEIFQTDACCGGKIV